jgi:endonuclease/exonuclease/phosphatase family metal-dependent hydrolase
MRKRFLITQIGSLAAVIILCNACTSGNKNHVEIKVISYNIRQSGLSNKDGEYQWDNRKQATIKMIEQETPSIFGLQEALLEQVEYIETYLPQYSNVGVGRDDGQKAGEFMSIFYLSDKFNLLKSGTFWLSETPDNVSKGWDAECFRTVEWVQLQEIESKKEFFFFNTHFDHKGILARENSAKLVAEKIKEIAGKEASIILGGDLNSDISAPIFKPLKKFMKVARECSPITDSRGTMNGFGTTPNNIVLDHFFCQNVECKKYRTLDGDYGVPYISDHYPIEFVFELK